MNIAELVFQALSSGSDGLRAFHDKLPAKGDDNYILPMAVITVVAGRDDMDLSGDASLRRRLIQLDTWAASRRFADDAMETARAKMQAATAFKVGAIDVSGAPDYDAEVNLFRASLEFAVWFSQ